MWFDMPKSKTVDSVGAKTVLLKTTGHEKTRFTVVLACLADGTKLKPMVIFKRKTMPKDNFPTGVVVHNHPKGWMDENGVKILDREGLASTTGRICEHPKFTCLGLVQCPPH